MRLLITLLFLFVALPAQAAEPLAPSLNLRGTYQIYWNGIPFAKLWVALEQADPAHFTLTATLKSKGMVRWFKKVKTLTVSKGLFTAHGWQTLSYRTTANYSDESTLTELGYNEAGELTLRTINPEDDPNYRPLVPAQQVAQAHSLGSALFALRESVSAMLRDQQNNTTLPLYDGKRLMAISIERLPDAAQRDREYYVVAVTRALVAGMTEKEVRRMAEGEPPVILYLTKDANVFPLAMEVALGFGSLSARFEPE